jgi:hypothetical protein
MNTVTETEMSPNATAQSGRVNGVTTQDTSSKTSAAAADKGTKVTFGATAGMPGRFKGNFDYQFVRTMGCVTYGGAALGECYETASRIQDEIEDSYSEAWRVTAERVEAIARKSLAGRHLVSAREAFLRASSYWREVGFFQLQTDPRCRASWERQQDCFMQAGKLMDLPFEAVNIPYENGKLPGYFLKADASDEPRPTLMSVGGGDSLAEELYFWGGGAAALQRGYNALLFEIPGQRGAMYSNPGAELFYRPDTEVPLKYVCDWVLGRADVDPKRLALAGWSMGGNFAPRAAAFEKRIKACIASTTSPDMQTSLLEMLGLPGDRPYPRDLESTLDLSSVGHRFLVAKGDIRYRMGVGGGTIAEFIDVLSKYSLWGLEDKITCPYFNIGGQGEGQLAVDGQKFYDKLTCPKAQHIVTTKEGGEAHCGANNESLEHQIVFDWLDEVFK